MAQFLKKRWPLLFVLTVFIICKIPHLHYAYYWDESTPYAVAVREMYRHGASLLPTALSPDLSRGHPLFFHSAAAVWMTIFGTSHISLHSFALFISALCLIAVYEAGIRLFNRRVAVMSILLIATQVAFFVQASFVLPEVLVALFIFLSLYFYTKDRYALTILCLTALFYTKESGLVLGFVLGADAFIGLFNKNSTGKERLWRMLSVFIPCLLTAVFFIIQKHVSGWYIYPPHVNYIEHTWAAFWYNFRINSLVSMFVRDNRYYYFTLLLALTSLAAIKNKNIRYLVFFIPAICLYYFVDDTRAGRVMPSVPFFISFVLSLVLLLYVLKRLKIYKNTYQEKFIVLSVVFIFCFCCFSAVNFFTPRYMLAAIIPLLFFWSVLMDTLFRRTYTVLYYPTLLVILVTGLYTFKTDVDFGDSDVGAFDGLDVQQHVVDWFEKNNYYDKAIGVGGPLEREHLQNPETGFLHSDKAFKNASWDMDANITDFMIFDNLENDYRYNDVKKNPGYHVVYRYQKGRVWAEVYGRN